MARVRVSQRIVDRYRSALDIADRKFKAEALPAIERMHAYMRGDQWARTESVQSRRIRKIVVNLIFADIKVILPALALRNPRIFVKPAGATQRMPAMTATGPKMVPVQMVNGRLVPLLDAARAQEALVNWRWRSLQTNKQVRRCIVDALTAPFGIMKHGYTLQTEKVSVPSDLVEGHARLLEVHELIRAESPYAVRWSPLDFRMDPEARYPDLSDAGWIAFGWTARLDDVRDNPRFSNTRNLESNIEIKTDYPDSSSGDRFGMPQRSYDLDEDENKRVRLWEIWDKRTHMRIVIADDYDKALEYIDWPLVHANFPAETLSLSEHPDRAYGPPDLWHVLDQQDAYNRIATMVHNHVSRFVRKYGATRGTLDAKELDKLLQPEDGAIVLVEGKVGDSLVPIQDAPIPNDWWQTRVNFREDHDRVSGVADFMRGSAEKVDTATEASLLQSNLNVRTSDTRQLVENFAQRVAKQLLLIDAQTLDLPRAVPVIGPDGVQALDNYVNIPDKSFLISDTDVEIEVGSMQPINYEARKRDLTTVYGMLHNDPLTDQFELRRRLAPAFGNTIYDFEGLFISREQMPQVAAGMGMQLPGQPPAGPSGAPSRPPGPVAPPPGPGGPRPGPATAAPAEV